MNQPQPAADSIEVAEAFSEAVEAAFAAGLAQGLAARSRFASDDFTRGYLSGLVRHAGKPAPDFFGERWVKRIVDRLMLYAEVRIVEHEPEQFDDEVAS